MEKRISQGKGCPSTACSCSSQMKVDVRRAMVQVDTFSWTFSYMSKNNKIITKFSLIWHIIVSALLWSFFKGESKLVRLLAKNQHSRIANDSSKCFKNWSYQKMLWSPLSMLIFSTKTKLILIHHWEIP